MKKSSNRSTIIAAGRVNVRDHSQAPCAHLPPPSLSQLSSLHLSQKSDASLATTIGAAAIAPGNSIIVASFII